MIRLLTLHIFIAVLATTGVTRTALSEDIVVLLSINTVGNTELLSAARSECGMDSARYINLAEIDEFNLQQLLYSTRAKAVLAIGDKAYRLASSNAQKVPVIGAMTTDRNFNTISYMPPPEKYLAAMRKLGRKSVAVIYSRKTASYVRKAAELSGGYGVTLISGESSSPTEAMDLFMSLIKQADALWMLPDSNILTTGSAELLLRSAQDRKIPVFAFSRKHLEKGAAVVIEPDRDRIGRIVGEAVCSTANNGSATLLKEDPYRESSNDLIFKQLGLTTPNLED